MVSPKGGEPRPCTNNAQEQNGWCGVHFASEIERIRRAEQQAVTTAKMNERIEAHIAMSAADPWFWLEHITPSNDEARGLPPFTSPRRSPDDQP
jgi:hypothetical protein